MGNEIYSALFVLSEKSNLRMVTLLLLPPFPPNSHLMLVKISLLHFETLGINP